MLLTHQERTLLTAMTIAIIVTTGLILWLSFHRQSNSTILANKNVHVIDTGGYQEQEPNLTEQAKTNKNRIAKFDISQYNPPLLPSEVGPIDWNRLADAIQTAYTQYDAFVIIHGHDTLTYTASALAFILENLNKPVILTDGPIFPAILKASTTQIPEVMVYSNNNLYRGCCTSTLVRGFTSFHTNTLTNRNSLQKPSTQMTVRPLNPNISVVVVKLFPKITAEFLAQLGNTKKMPNGIVLETYGKGNSTIDAGFLSVISKMVQQGVVIVGVSQTHGATPPFSMDEKLVTAGVLDGEDMTTESAVCKLYFLLSHEPNRQNIGRLMSNSLRGELSNIIN